jgi:hypothetical protein
MSFWKPVFLGVLFSVQSAMACRCLAPKSGEEAWAAADAVFSGRVLKVTKKPTKDRYSTQVDFEVLEPWKGVNGSRLSVTTGQSAKDCGYPFKAGVRYLVFAFDSNDLKTDKCTRTVELEVAKADLKDLKKKILKDVVAEPSPKASLAWAFHQKDVGTILQLVLDDERLDAYFKIDTKPERKPLVVLENQFTKRASNLKKFGQPVVLLERKKTTESTPLLDISEVTFEKDSANVRFFYTPERIRGDVGLKKAAADWKIERFDLAQQ